MKVTERALALIKEHEGLRLSAYLCPANKPTIGYGATFYQDGSKVKIGDKITTEEADKLLAFHINHFSKGLISLVPKSLNDNQFSALVSFSFNVGIGNFKASTLRRHILSNKTEQEIREQFNRWVYSKGKKLNGLIKRRKDEADLYFS
jgi:lysozyme